MEQSKVIIVFSPAVWQDALPYQISWARNNNSFETFAIEVTPDQWSYHIKDFSLLARQDSYL